MKNILNDEKIDMSYENNEIDIENIKKMTFLKIKSAKPKLKVLKNSLLAVASFTLIITLGGATVYATGSPEIRGFINEILGLPAGEILYVGESISNDDYTVTILDVAYDGVSGTMTYSVSPISDKAKESFDEFDGIDFFRQTGLSASMREHTDYQEENSKVYEYSFDNDITSEHRLSELKISFEGINDYILIPLENTTESIKTEVFIPETDYSLATFNSISYSKLGFTLIGTIDNEIYQNFALSEEAVRNINIKFAMKDGEIVDYIEEIYDYGTEEQYMNFFDDIRENPDVHIEEIIIKHGYNPFMPVISYSNDDLYSGESGSAFENEQGEIILERTFTFKQAFDWTLVDKIIVNGTEIDIE